MKSELDLFKNISFQKSIESSQSIQYRPTNSISDSQSVEFDIPIAADEYLDLQNTYLWIKAKIVKQDGSNYEENQDDRYSMINYGLNTIFDQLSVYLGGTLVSQSSKTYHYLSYIEILTQSFNTTTHTHLSTSGFAAAIGDDDSEKINTIQLSPISHRSKLFSLYGKIHGSIFNTDKLLMNGVPLHLIFTRAPDKFCLMGSAARAAVAAVVGPPAQDAIQALAATEPKLKLIDMSIFVRKVKLSPNILNAHAKALQISKAIYPIKRSTVKVINLPQNQSTFVLDNVIMGQMPCKIVLGFVSNNAFSGSYTLNPFNFKNFDLTYLTVNINGETYPKLPYEPDFRDVSLNISREYFEFMSNLGAIHSIAQPPIYFHTYHKGLSLFAFNFNSDFENPQENEYINPPKEGFLSVEIKFRANLTEAIKMICYAQFDNLIEIDQNRNVTVDYS